MAYDEVLAARVRDVLAGEPALTEKRMFGGLAFLLDGHMAVAVSGQGGLMVRVEPAETEALVQRPGVGPMIMRERALDGWVRVTDDAVADEPALREWTQRGAAFARGLTAR